MTFFEHADGNHDGDVRMRETRARRTPECARATSDSTGPTRTVRDHGLLRRRDTDRVAFGERVVFSSPLLEQTSHAEAVTA